MSSEQESNYSFDTEKNAEQLLEILRVVIPPENDVQVQEAMALFTRADDIIRYYPRAILGTSLEPAKNELVRVAQLSRRVIIEHIVAIASELPKRRTGSAITPEVYDAIDRMLASVSPDDRNPIINKHIEMGNYDLRLAQIPHYNPYDLIQTRMASIRNSSFSSTERDERFNTLRKRENLFEEMIPHLDTTANKIRPVYRQNKVFNSLRYDPSSMSRDIAAWVGLSPKAQEDAFRTDTSPDNYSLERKIALETKIKQLREALKSGQYRKAEDNIPQNEPLLEVNDIPELNSAENVKRAFVLLSDAEDIKDDFYMSIVPNENVADTMKLPLSVQQAFEVSREVARRIINLAQRKPISLDDKTYNLVTSIVRNIPERIVNIVIELQETINIRKDNLKTYYPTIDQDASIEEQLRQARLKKKERRELRRSLEDFANQKKILQEQLDNAADELYEEYLDHEGDF